MPYILDIKTVERTYYDIDPIYYSIISEIPDDLLKISTNIIDKARDTIKKSIGSNIVFTLADHINFAIQRHKKNLNIKLPIVSDIEQLFEPEYKIGLYGLKLIRDNKIWLPDDEAAYIALHIINSEEKEKNGNELNEDMINEIITMIEREYKIAVDKKSFNYSRFISHIQYLFKRINAKESINSDNLNLFIITKEKYPLSYHCSELISSYLENKLKFCLNDEEKLYLILHINRLCIREECNR